MPYEQSAHWPKQQSPAPLDDAQPQHAVAYGGYPAAAYFALADRVAEMTGTEERSTFVSSVFPDANDQVAFFAFVKVAATIETGRVREKTLRNIDGYAQEAYEKARGREAGLARVAEEKYAESGATAQVSMSGGAFLFDGTDDVTAVWGDGNDVILADGEALMLVGSPGVGKTTVANQFLRARLGITDKALGYSVIPTKSKVLYLACDRPRQWKRAAKRLFSEQELATLDDKLVVWPGPPPEDFVTHPEAMLQMALDAGADTIIVDSLKDVVQGDLGSSDVGTSYNRARQMCLVNGIVVLELHHQVKRGANGSAPNTLADVFGSAWLTAGAGSVVILDGEAGDPVVKWRHLKQPLNEVGPVDLLHDQETGVSAFAARTDLVALAFRTAITALDAARVMFDTDKPKPAQKEKARRRLEGLCRSGLLMEISGAIGQATTYVPRTTTTYASEPRGGPSWATDELDDTDD